MVHSIGIVVFAFFGLKRDIIKGLLHSALPNFFSEIILSTYANETTKTELQEKKEKQEKEEKEEKEEKQDKKEDF